MQRTDLGLVSGWASRRVSSGIHARRSQTKAAPQAYRLGRNRPPDRRYPALRPAASPPPSAQPCRGGAPRGRSPLGHRPQRSPEHRSGPKHPARPAHQAQRPRLQSRRRATTPQLRARFRATRHTQTPPPYPSPDRPDRAQRRSRSSDLGLEMTRGRPSLLANLLLDSFCAVPAPHGPPVPFDSDRLGVAARPARLAGPARALSSTARPCRISRRRCRILRRSRGLARPPPRAGAHGRNAGQTSLAVGASMGTSSSFRSDALDGRRLQRNRFP